MNLKTGSRNMSKSAVKKDLGRALVSKDCKSLAIERYD